MLKTVKRVMKAQYTGISWRNPVFRMALPLLDISDMAVRRVGGRNRLPRYSHRIRSNGISGQFGGRKFEEFGGQFNHLARSVADLSPETDTLEVGCGCGRIALALERHLNHGKYTGMDVDGVSVEACKRNRALKDAGFRFLKANVRTDLYNPEGLVEANEYTFPFADGSFDTILLYSVFTHMLPEEVENYIEEFGRMLRPGGLLLFSAFLTDFGIGEGSMSFSHDYGQYRLHQKSMPRKAVAYPLSFFEATRIRHGTLRHAKTLVGTWRLDPRTKPDTELSQDLLLYHQSHA